MIGYYNYTVWLTYASVCSAVTGIWMAAGRHPFAAVLCLILCGFCDAFDGRVARRKENRSEDEKKFGIQIDSLSDVLAFGMLPAAIGFTLAPPHGVRMLCYLPVAMLYVLAALIRLAFFNVREETRQAADEDAAVVYRGMPVTLCVFFVMIVWALRPFLPELCFLPVYGTVLLGVAVLFVAPFSLKKPGHGVIGLLLALGAGLLGVLLFEFFRGLL